jgi:putative N6-adenine-specific DNA methylase
MSERNYFAACGRGLEPALVEELAGLGFASIVERRGGVAFRTDLTGGYRACLWLRSAIRVQEELLDTRVHDTDELYEVIYNLDWNRWLAPDQTLAIDASTRDAPPFRHSGYTAMRAKDAIVDQQRQRHGRRSSVDTHTPDVPLKLVIQENHLLLYRDLAGSSLHKRGYRPVQVKSPLNEATAAALLLRSGWDRASPLVDPMCGSGTFVIEAALLATDRAPGLDRTFPFEAWVDFDRDAWSALRAEARARIRPELGFLLAGADRHPGAVAIAKDSAVRAQVDHLVSFRQAEARTWQPSTPPAFVVTNPPYGERIGQDDEDREDSWQALGVFLRAQCPGAEAWILSGDKDVTRHLRMRTSARVPVMNGPIECRWLRYLVR